VQRWQVLPIEHVFPYPVDPDADLAGIDRGDREFGGDPELGAIDRHSGATILRISLVFRGKTTLGSSRDTWSSDAMAPASARRRAAPITEIAATWSHGHCAHACGSPFLRGLAALTYWRNSTGWRRAPQFPGRASNTPGSGVPQCVQHPSSARCQRVRSNQSRPINRAPQPPHQVLPPVLS